MILKGFVKKAACILLAAAMLGTCVTPALAEEGQTEELTSNPTPTEDPHVEDYYIEPRTNSWKDWPEGPMIEGTAAIAMDLRTGAILYAKNDNKRLYPASITKVMTCLLACENLDMNGQMVMSQSAAFGIEAGSSSIYADTDEVFTMEQAMMALMLESANEIALRIAEMVSGSEKKFTELMNKRARQLGCTGTHFNNPNGLPDKYHYTTVSDMAKIAAAAWRNPLARRFMTTNFYDIPPTNKQPETRYFRNHHKMMKENERAYDGVLGGKTGYTNAAWCTLVTYARRGNMPVLVVVMHSIDGCYGDTAKILDYVFDYFTQSNMGYPVGKKATGAFRYPHMALLQKNSGDVVPFYYRTKAVVTLPNGVKKKKVKRVQITMPSVLGLPYVLNEFYYRGQLVGKTLQYEQEVLSDLWK
ncbi:MAG: D-alanyl-D-alanine carboxypeptidase [Blautia sp.]|nr:D-alanyl-D-alanine carboxypeptidase [Blautia sp.]